MQAYTTVQCLYVRKIELLGDEHISYARACCYCCCCGCRLQERIEQDRNDIEKQRRNLQKRKPPSSEALEKKRAKKDSDGFVKPAEKRCAIFPSISSSRCF